MYPCGTHQAYRRHRRAGEEACEPCSEAMRANGRAQAQALRDRKLAKGWIPMQPGPRPIENHGTMTGYRRHYKHGEKPCSDCRAAGNQWLRQRYLRSVGGALKVKDDRPEPRKGHKWRVARQAVLTEEVDCWLCGEWVDRRLVFPDDKSASVDHVVPLSKGGPLLERDNLRLSHLGCNRDRGNKDFFANLE